MPGSLAPQGDLRAIHLKNLRIASRSAPSSNNPRPWQEAQFHQAARILAGKIDPIEDGDFPAP
jgi:hypothetical protein